MAKVHDHAMRGERKRRGAGQQRQDGMKTWNAKSGRKEEFRDMRQKELFRTKE